MNRFRDMGVHPYRQAPFDIISESKRCNSDYRDIGRICMVGAAYFFCRRQSVHYRHLYIHQYDIYTLLHVAGGVVSHRIEFVVLVCKIHYYES